MTGNFKAVYSSDHTAEKKYKQRLYLKILLNIVFFSPKQEQFFLKYHFEILSLKKSHWSTKTFTEKLKGVIYILLMLISEMHSEFCYHP